MALAICAAVSAFVVPRAKFKPEVAVPLVPTVIVWLMTGVGKPPLVFDKLRAVAPAQFETTGTEVPET